MYVSCSIEKRPPGWTPIFPYTAPCHHLTYIVLAPRHQFLPTRSAEEFVYRSLNIASLGSLHETRVSDPSILCPCFCSCCFFFFFCEAASNLFPLSLASHNALPSFTTTASILGGKYFRIRRYAWASVSVQTWSLRCCSLCMFSLVCFCLTSVSVGIDGTHCKIFLPTWFIIILSASLGSHLPLTDRCWDIT
ncbi:hypothetical protein V8F33_012926 [Rhypophila sp. PSN 637]